MRTMTARLASTARWVSITPRGAPVEPEVYCKSARSSGPAATGAHAPATASSVATTGTCPCSPSSAVNHARPAASTSAAFGRASASSRPSRARVRADRT